MHANKRLTLLAVSALFLGAASPAPAIDGDGATAGPTEEATVEEAIRFRQAFGFPADLATVQSARLDEASYSDEPYGVPLSDAEVAEMLRAAPRSSGRSTPLSTKFGPATTSLAPTSINRPEAFRSSCSRMPTRPRSG